MTLSELIEKAGGVDAVARKLRYASVTVRNWKYGTCLPSSKRRLRADLCRLAGVTMEDVVWELKRKQT